MTLMALNNKITSVVPCAKYIKIIQQAREDNQDNQTC